WMLRLRDEQTGKVAPPRPWLVWVRAALTRKDYDVAKEHCEHGIVVEPENVELLLEFSRLLATQYKNKDRAVKLALRALQILEHEKHVDEKRVKEADSFLASLDTKRRTLEKILEQLERSARSIAQRYLLGSRPLMAMEVSWRLGTDLDMPSLFTI